jgi:propionyl-CoA synthetase
MCTGLMSKDDLEKHLPANVQGKPVPGFDLRILKDEHSLTEAKRNEVGRIVIKLPLPPGTISTLWENDQLFVSTYFKSYPGYYDTADVGFISDDGFLSFISRADDLINVCEHPIAGSAYEEVNFDIMVFI